MRYAAARYLRFIRSSSGGGVSRAASLPLQRPGRWSTIPLVLRRATQVLRRSRKVIRGLRQHGADAGRPDCEVAAQWRALEARQDSKRLAPGPVRLVSTAGRGRISWMAMEGIRRHSAAHRGRACQISCCKSFCPD